MKSGQVLKQILKEKGIKNCWFAEQLGISRSTLVSRLNSDIRISDTIKICEVLHITIDEFFERCKEAK